MKVSRFRAGTDFGPQRYPERPNPLLRVVIPFVPNRLEPRTRAWGEANGAEFIDTSGDGEAYFNCVADLWRGGESFALIDHDIVPPPGAVEGFAACAADVCAHPFFVYSAVNLEELGCVRFSRAIVRRFPNLVEEAPERWDEALEWHRPINESARHWQWVTILLRMSLAAAGVQWHEHNPPAEHIRDMRAVWARELRRWPRMRRSRRPGDGAAFAVFSVLHDNKE